MLTLSDKETLRKISFHRISFEKEDGKHLIYRCKSNCFILEKETDDFSYSEPIFTDIVSQINQLGYTVSKQTPKLANALIQITQKNFPILNNNKSVIIQEGFCYLRNGLAWPAFYNENDHSNDNVLFISNTYLDAISEKKSDEFYVHIST